MVIPIYDIYGYDNHDICYDIICFFWRYGAGARVEDDGLNNYPESWHDADEPAEKCIERPMEPVFFFVISSPNPKLFQKKIMDVTKQIEKHIMLTSIKTSGK